MDKKQADKKQTQTQEEEEDKDQIECPICLQALSDKDFCVTSCEHKFHCSCLVKASTKKPQCPICRKALFEKDLAETSEVLQVADIFFFTLVPTPLPILEEEEAIPPPVEEDTDYSDLPNLIPL
jgi:Ring finger domain